MKKFDIGLMWAKIVNIWGQLGTLAGIANTIMLIGVFYTTTVYPNVKIPLWLYLMVIVIIISCAVIFIVKIGISGWFRFFSKQSQISALERKIDLIMRELKIEDTIKK